MYTTILPALVAAAATWPASATVYAVGPHVVSSPAELTLVVLQRPPGAGWTFDPRQAQRPHRLPLVVRWTGRDGVWLLALSREPKGGVFRLAGGPWVHGLVRVRGDYEGPYARPIGFTGTSAELARDLPTCKLVRAAFPGATGAWPGDGTFHLAAAIRAEARPPAAAVAVAQALPSSPPVPTPFRPARTPDTRPWVPGQRFPDDATQVPDLVYPSPSPRWPTFLTIYVEGHEVLLTPPTRTVFDDAGVTPKLAGLEPSLKPVLPFLPAPKPHPNSEIAGGLAERPLTLRIANTWEGPDGCWLAALSRDPQGAVYQNKQGAWVHGLVRVRGGYVGNDHAQPAGYTGKPAALARDPRFIKLIREHFPRAKGAWPGNDTYEFKLLIHPD